MQRCNSAISYCRLFSQRLVQKHYVIWLRAVLLCIACGLSLSTYAEKNRGVDDSNNGVLRIHGILAESACRLEMASAWQDIDLGEIGTARLAHVGKQGTPVSFQAKKCLCHSSVVTSPALSAGNSSHGNNKSVVPLLGILAGNVRTH